MEIFLFFLYYILGFIASGIIILMYVSGPPERWGFEDCCLMTLITGVLALFWPLVLPCLIVLLLCKRSNISLRVHFVRFLRKLGKSLRND